jgi:Protein of unknown function (DUF3618)
MTTTRSPAELEPEIEASRQALARDVGALKEKVAPRQMLSDALTTVGARGREAGRRALRTASSNPVWLSVIGGGIVAAAGGGAFLLVRLLAARRRPKSLPERITAAIAARVH